MAWLKGLLLAAIVFAAGMAIYFYHQFNLPNNRREETMIMIDKGAGSRQVAKKLTEAGVISHPLLFRLSARLSGLDKHLKAGEYVFLPGISMREVLDVISRGEVHYRQVTLPEGLTTAQMLRLIAAEPALEGEVTLEIAEGELLPETYSYVRGDSRDSIVRRARAAMQRVLEDAWAQKSRPEMIKDRHQLLILASIVEKETGLTSERADVAAVFVNRLRRGMKLQTDPTVIYAPDRREDGTRTPFVQKKTWRLTVRITLTNITVCRRDRFAIRGVRQFGRLSIPVMPIIFILSLREKAAIVFPAALTNTTAMSVCIKKR